MKGTDSLKKLIEDEIYNPNTPTAIEEFEFRVESLPGKKKAKKPVVAATTEGLTRALLRPVFHFLDVTNLALHSKGAINTLSAVFCHEACAHSSKPGSAEILPVLSDPNQCLSHSSPGPLVQQAMHVVGHITLVPDRTVCLPMPCEGFHRRLLDKSATAKLAAKMLLQRLWDKVSCETLFFITHD